MNLKLLIGVLLFVVGLVTAGIGIVSVTAPIGPDVAVEADQNAGPLARASLNVLIPLVAGLSLGIGGLLIGLSLGNWKHPRTHLEPGDKVVDPEGYHKMRHV
jgi:hypothetical protein